MSSTIGLIPELAEERGLNVALWIAQVLLALFFIYGLMAWNGVLSLTASRLLPKEEYFSPGHRACQGCGEALAVRLRCEPAVEAQLVCRGEEEAGLVREAVDVVKKSAYAKFDESVDIALRLGIDPKRSDQMVRGTTALPHGTGKKVRVLASPFQTEQIAKLGGTGIAMSLGDVLPAGFLADLVVQAMMSRGVPESEARSRIWLMNSSRRPGSGRAR